MWLFYNQSVTYNMLNHIVCEAEKKDMIIKNVTRQGSKQHMEKRTTFLVYSRFLITFPQVRYIFGVDLL